MCPSELTCDLCHGCGKLPYIAFWELWSMSPQCNRSEFRRHWEVMLLPLCNRSDTRRPLPITDLTEHRLVHKTEEFVEIHGSGSMKPMDGRPPRPLISLVCAHPYSIVLCQINIRAKNFLQRLDWGEKITRSISFNIYNLFFFQLRPKAVYNILSLPFYLCKSHVK